MFVILTNFVTRFLKTVHVNTHMKMQYKTISYSFWITFKKEKLSYLPFGNISHHRQIQLNLSNIKLSQFSNHSIIQIFFLFYTI